MCTNTASASARLFTRSQPWRGYFSVPLQEPCHWDGALADGGVKARDWSGRTATSYIMKKAKKGHAVKAAKRMEGEKQREAQRAEQKKLEADKKRKEKLARMESDSKYLTAQIRKATVKAAAKPHAIVGWVLDIKQADGMSKRGTVITTIKSRMGAATKHLIHYEDGSEDAVELARKDGHTGMEKQKFELVRVQEPLPEKSGMLVKRAILSKKNWKKRFFVLDGRSKSLRYFKVSGSKPPDLSAKRAMPTPQGVFNLAARCTVKVYFDECEENPDGKPFCFAITSTETGRSLVLSAPDAGVMRSWVSVLEQTIEWAPGLEAKRKREAETRKMLNEAGLSDLEPREKQLCILAQKAVKALVEALDTGEGAITELLEELLRECCDIKPRMQALVEELILGRPALSEAVMKVNDMLDQTIDRAHGHLEKIGIAMYAEPDVDEGESEPDDDDSGDDFEDDEWSDDG